ncbi:phosphatase PAP2 family protein [Cecembia sp.]|uniref:phosphatase PAP2 family protein n=1 Tax=Cecembia sp. TaxID=1898110 RepID=UPI0025B857D5|nr:phosphatase PAP2 family protein [Cecembia sp.]
MLEIISSWDEALFLYLNGFHSDFFDPIMFTLTKTWPWVPMYAFFSFLIVKTYKKESWWVFMAIGLTILFADQTASGLMKPYFERLRPCHEPLLEGMVHNYGYCGGGKFGFASSHASNSFGVATIMTLTLAFRYPWLKWLFAWALLFSYTRIYLGVHYPGDILVGGFVGVMSATLGYLIMKMIKDRFFPDVKSPLPY